MRKIIIIFFTIIMTQCVIASEIGINLTTFHTFDRSKKYANKFDKYGAFMYNPMVTYNQNNHNFLAGVDSINSKIIGYFYNYNKFIVGFYTHSKKDWKNARLKHPDISLNDDIGLIPILGYRTDLKTFKNGNRIDLIATPLTMQLVFVIDLK